MEIKDLGQDTYLVGRRVIQAAVSGMFDLAKQEDRDELVRLANTLYTSKFNPAVHGVLTVCVLSPHVEIPGCAKYTLWQKHFSNLHGGAKEILRREFPEYADEI